MSSFLSQKVNSFFKVLESAQCSSAKRHLDLESGLHQLFQLIKEMKEKGNIFIIGNGGSAAVASHAAIDLRNVCKVSAFALNDPATLTCLSNDYGYENSYSGYLDVSARAGDLLLAISSSGESANILNAVGAAKEHGVMTITFSGFESTNSLRAVGDMNFWCDSNDYGIVEISHQFLIHNVTDRFL